VEDVERLAGEERGAIDRAYEEALTGALPVPFPPPGLVEARGASWLDLLQRMSTNDLAGMRSGQVRTTVLTTAVAHIVDWVSVVARPEGGLLVTNPGRARRVREWLQRYIFFQDDVRLEVMGEGWVRWGLYGPRAAEEAGRVVPGEIGPIGQATIWDGGAAWRVDQPAGGGVVILLAPDAAVRAAELWDNNADEAQRAYQILRIEAGLPEIGSEIQDDSLPLEVALKGAVSFTKGCYIGQEIIARMESRGRLAKELLGVRAAAAFAPGEEIRQGGRTVGSVTSSARSPRYGAIGLASVRPSALEASQGSVDIGERAVSGKLIRLPFDSGS
jgi:aminomethyltransferase